jgi:NIPSNAP
MIYRLRIYQAVPDGLASFHDFFRDYLLPIQQRHGARLVGRWQTEDDRVVAIWEYDDHVAYERIQAAVSVDPASRAAERRRQSLPMLYTEKVEVFMISTLDRTRDRTQGM